LKVFQKNFAVGGISARGIFALIQVLPKVKVVVKWHIEHVLNPLLEA
jgi:hypothetical protein